MLAVARGKKREQEWRKKWGEEGGGKEGEGREEGGRREREEDQERPEWSGSLKLSQKPVYFLSWNKIRSGRNSETLHTSISCLRCAFTSS